MADNSFIKRVRLALGIDKPPRKYHSVPSGLSGQRSRLTTTGPSGEETTGLGSYSLAPDKDTMWRELDLDSETLDSLSSAELIEYLADLSPEVSSAIWYFVRFCNPGWELRAYDVGTDEAHEIGQIAIDEFMSLLAEYYGAADAVWNSMFLTAFMRGAFVSELVADEGGRMPVDFIVIDPENDQIVFEEQNDPVRGEYWQLGQIQDGDFVRLDVPTVSYVPIDPPPKKPYGRSPVQPALFSSLFLLGLLHDLRRVVSQQGYPRLDLQINLERMTDIMPADIEDDPKSIEKWVDEIVNSVARVYGSLQPDDAYVHTDVVTVNRPVGTVDASSLGGIDSLIRSLERVITRALKTMPLLMGSNESVSETHANRQWEIHAAGVKAIQHLAEEQIGRLMTLALEMQGIQATAKMKFAELRASEALRDAQTESIIIANASAKYQAGWTSQNTASTEVTGVEADQEEPRMSGTSAEDILALLGPDLGAGEESDLESGAEGEGRTSVQELRESREALVLLMEALVMGVEDEFMEVMEMEIESIPGTAVDGSARMIP